MRFVLWVFSVFRVLGSSCVAVQHGSNSKAGDRSSFPKAGDTVTMHYVGTLANGRKFDSSRDRGKPFQTEIGTGQVIEGWDQGIPQLSLGETAVLRISAACGYGERGMPPVIPGGSELIFEVELLSINGKVAGSAVNRTLPSCTPSGCGFAMAEATTRIPLCACDASCLGEGSALPCCPAFKDVCEQPRAPQTAVSQRQPKPPATQTAVAQPQPARTSAQKTPEAKPQTPEAKPKTPPPATGLPECEANSCGKAISRDRSAMGKPVCLCSPLCDTMKGTPGVLPCCPKLQEVCLDPWREPSTPQTKSKPDSATVGGTTATAVASVPPTRARVHPPKGKMSAAVCALAATKWEEADCPAKRYGMRNKKCSKVCDAVQPNAALRYWPRTDAGQAACEAAVALCFKTNP
jgi:FK506-binding protein 1